MGQHTPVPAESPQRRREENVDLLCRYGTDYECWCAFVRHTSDLPRISEAWARAALTRSGCSNLAAMYFLWGAVHGDHKPGYVEYSALFDLMQRLECVGIPTRWPNPVSLYRVLSSKSWQASLATNTSLRIPPTTTIQRADFMQDPTGTCRKALRALQIQASVLWNNTRSLSVYSERGVVKIGYSWMAEGVKAFYGITDLEVKTRALWESLPNNESTLMLQHRIEDIVTEPRVFVFNGKVEHIRYTEYVNEETGSGRFRQFRTFSSRDATYRYFNGDHKTRLVIEGRIRELVEQWMLWINTAVGCTVPCFVRLDFLVSKAKPGSTTAVGGVSKRQQASRGTEITTGCSDGDDDDEEDDWYAEESSDDELGASDSEPVSPSGSYVSADSGDGVVSLDDDTDFGYEVWTGEVGEIGSSMVGYRDGRQRFFECMAKSCLPDVGKPSRPAGLPKSDTVRGDKNGPGRIDELSGSIGEHAVDSGGDMGDSEHLIPCDRRLAPSEVAKHDSRDDCWIIVNGRVLDVTGFLGDHPGGEKSILNFAGRDASRMFNMIHSPDVIEKFLPEDKILGPVAEEEPAGSKVDEVDVHSEEDHEKREDTFVVPRCCRNSESDTTTSVHHVDESEGGSAVDREDAGEAHTEPAESWLVLGGQVHDMTSVLPDLLDGTDESILAFGGMHLAEGACPSNSDTAVQLGDGSTVSPVDFLPVESESEEPVPQAGRRYIPMTEVAKHCSEDDCWIVINGEVLDVTSFLSEHPGGKKPILSVAGGDASEKYNLVHPKEFVEKYVPNLVLGDLSHDGQEVARSSPEEALSLGFSEVAQRYLVSFYYLVLLFVKEALRSIFTVENFKVLSDRSGLTRSAIFLMAFVTIHALGNIHLFFGAEHFNGYAHFLNHPVPVIDTLARPIEIYLLLAGLMHVIVAVDRTFKFKKERLSLKDMEMGITGAILLVFLLVHLLQFRLAPDAVFAPFDFRSRWLPPFHCSPDNASCEMVRVRDLYKGVFDLFKSPFWVLFYAIGTAACFHHMREGLHRIVRSSEDVPYKYNLTVQTWGSVMAWVVGILFLSFPLYAYLNNENRLV